MKKLLVIQVAALGHGLLRENKALRWQGLDFAPAQSVFPALTCPVQASFRTASPPEAHGMVANGVFNRELGRPMFWEQSSRLVSGPRILSSGTAFGVRPDGWYLTCQHVVSDAKGSPTLLVGDRELPAQVVASRPP